MISDAPVDFGVPSEEAREKKGKNLLTSKTNVHSGDTSSSEDELNRNPGSEDQRYFSINFQPSVGMMARPQGQKFSGGM